MAAELLTLFRPRAIITFFIPKPPPTQALDSSPNEYVLPLRGGDWKGGARALAERNRIVAVFPTLKLSVRHQH